MAVANWTKSFGSKTRASRRYSLEFFVSSLSTIPPTRASECVWTIIYYNPIRIAARVRVDINRFAINTLPPRRIKTNAISAAILKQWNYVHNFHDCKQIRWNADWTHTLFILCSCRYDRWKSAPKNFRKIGKCENSHLSLWHAHKQYYTHTHKHSCMTWMNFMVFVYRIGVC